MTGGFERYLRLLLLVELSLNSKELFHLLEAMNRTWKSLLLVVTTRSRDVLIVQWSPEISLVLKDLRKGIKQAHAEWQKLIRVHFHYQTYFLFFPLSSIQC